MNDSRRSIAPFASGDIERYHLAPGELRRANKGYHHRHHDGEYDYNERSTKSDLMKGPYHPKFVDHPAHAQPNLCRLNSFFKPVRC